MVGRGSEVSVDDAGAGCCHDIAVVGFTVGSVEAEASSMLPCLLVRVLDERLTCA